MKKRAESFFLTKVCYGFAHYELMIEAAEISFFGRLKLKVKLVFDPCSKFQNTCERTNEGFAFMEIC